MSTEKPQHEFDLQQLAGALFANRGITSGLWRLAAKLRFAAITANNSGVDMPTGLVGFEGIALFEADAPGPLVFEAGKVTAKRSAAKRLPSARAGRPKRRVEKAS